MAVAGVPGGPTARVLTRALLLATAVLGTLGPARAQTPDPALNCPATPTDPLARPPTLDLQCGRECAPLTLEDDDECRWDVSDCQGLSAGNICAIRCKAPYVGPATFGRCPPNNNDPANQPVWEPPDCLVRPEDLGSVICTDPNPVPEGYRRNAQGKWVCATGYVGTVLGQCAPGRKCDVELQLTGCRRLAPCILPRVDPCEVDLTECRSVKPGAMCAAHCKLPYAGPSSMALCKPGNSNPEQELLLVPPECVLLCDDPIFDPVGYRRNSTGHWGCAAGYGGEAKGVCAMDTGCASYKELTGCAPLAPCIIPDADACMYDFSDCTSVEPGAPCQVRCRSPFVGGVTTAFCPSGNIDPWGPVIWSDPGCTLECPMIMPTRVGYIQYPFIMTPQGWACVDGFAGNVRMSCAASPECLPELRLEGCLPIEPCAPIAQTPEEFCQFDVNPCLLVNSGLSCEVECKEPFVGTMVQAVCPAFNTIVGRLMDFTKPSCALVCPEPAEIPAGYVEDGRGGWYCHRTYLGSPTVECVIDYSTCVAQYVFSGCNLLAACELPAEGKDNCWLDWSDCQQVYGGSNCTLACKSPWDTVQSTIAVCPDGNVNESTPLEWQMPPCHKTCVEPLDGEIPGYTKPRVDCAEGYAGTALENCGLNEYCEPTLQYSGCLPLAPCLLPTEGVDRCKLDFSNCTGILPGQSCEVRCGGSYEGAATRAFCPEGNIDAAQGVLWVPPRCEIRTPVPDVVPLGYVPPKKCGWQCGMGYGGDAVQTCTVNETDCSLINEVSGCTLMQPCAPITAEGVLGCQLDTSACPERMQPGQFCHLKCGAPFVGLPKLLKCPANNNDAEALPEGIQDLMCTLDMPISDCAVPDPLPPGYVSNGTDSWQCAEWYVGQADYKCVMNSTCGANVEFEGCIPIVACKIPEWDECQFETRNCISTTHIQSGETCQVKCKLPYIGPYFGLPTFVTCPFPNTDPDRAVWGQDAPEGKVAWTLPTCFLRCGQVAEQEGYRLIGSDIWACATGWTGMAVQQICERVPGTCIAQPMLTGCKELVPCAPLILTGDDRCTVDYGDCQRVDAGLSCTIACKAPMKGDSTIARCMAGNTLATRQLYWDLPTCSCVIAHDRAPPGYKLMDSNAQIWACDVGYIGVASATCHFEDDCSVRYGFQGCTEIVPCEGVELPDPYWEPIPITHNTSNSSWCRFDLSNCSVVEAGQNCDVTCSWPFEGPVMAGVCPWNNTNRHSEPQWPREACGFTCDRGELPEAYLMEPAVPWRCAEGYRGSVYTRCYQAGEGDCTDTLHLYGCRPLRNCTLPNVTAQEGCRMDFSNCTNLAPGQFCGISCKLPYRSAGALGMAFCPPDNVDPQQELIYSAPTCSLNCLEPLFPPQGYVKTNDCGWQCAPAYAGTAVETCTTNDQCVPEIQLRGCALSRHCAPPSHLIPPVANPDHCLFDARQCTHSLGGSKLSSLPPTVSCLIRCRAPSVGTEVTATCYEENTLMDAPLTYQEPSCDLSCTDPDPLIPGYVKVSGTSGGLLLNGTDSVFECAYRYIGQAKPPRCSFDTTCTTVSMILDGCVALYPCLEPEWDNRCMLNLTACSEAWPGSSCDMACLHPYVGTSAGGYCPDLNTLDNRSLDWTDPTCVLTCQEPSQPPPGYTKGDGVYVAETLHGTSEGTNWTCSSNAVGTASARCVLDEEGCTSSIEFTGCDLKRPCATPEAMCGVEMTGCSGLLPATNCTARCRAPFVGDHAYARCPWDNIDIRNPPIWSPAAPACQCPNITAAPRGYARSASGEWQCAEDYTGTVSEVCQCDGQRVLSGCVSKRACKVPRSELLADPAQCTTTEPGENCTARCVNADCVTTGSLVFHCPETNTDPFREPDLVEGRCGVTCEVCEASAFQDTNGIEGFMSGKLLFGPAHSNDRLNMTDIEGYVVYFADACYKRLSADIAVIPRGTQKYECCLVDAYGYEFKDVQVPIGAKALMLAIHSANTTLPFGRPVVFEDKVPLRSGGGGGSSVRPVRSASRPGSAAGWVASLAAVGLALAAASA